MKLAQIPILTYHGLDNISSPLFFSPDEFNMHLETLAASGRKTLPLAKVLEHLQQGDSLPENAVVITFDDGYETVYHEAWPRLRSYGFTATVFLVTDYCGRDNRWPGQPASVPTRPLLTWAQIESMSVEGCEFGAHTCTHPALISLASSDVEEEIAKSQAAVREHTNQLARTFAYPYGACNASVKNLVQKYFDGALSTRLGAVDVNSDLYQLQRLDAYYLTPRLIQIMDQLQFGLYIKFRQWLRDARRFWVSDVPPSKQSVKVLR